MKADARDMLQGMKLVAEPTRLMILLHLARRPMSAKALCDALGRSHLIVNSHLGLLQKGGLVKQVQQGESTVYEAEKRALKALTDEVIGLIPK